MANGSQNNVSYQAQKWTNLRTFTIGETGKDVDGTTNISWSKDEILGASDSSKFLRGDKTWSNVLDGAFTANGTITANGGYLKSTLNGNTVQIGSQNTGFCHITNSADIPFWFNKNILIETGKTIGAADSGYRPFKLFLGRHTTSGSNALNANSPLIEFSNGNRSQYCQLIYDDYDSLVAPDSLTLVGNQNGIHFILKNGPIWVQGGSNAGGNVNRLTTSSGMPGNMQYNQSRRGTQIYANGIAFADPYNGNSNNDAGWIRHQETTVNAGELEIAVGDDGDETIVVRQYNTSNGIKRTLTLLSKDGYTFLPSYLNLGGGHEKNASSPSYVWGSNSSDNYLRSYQTGYLNVNSAGYLRDKTNSTASYLNYGRSGMTSASDFTWLCVWEGYSVAPASKGAVTAAVKANASGEWGIDVSGYSKKIKIAGGTGGTYYNLIGVPSYASGSQSVYVSSPAKVNNTTLQCTNFQPGSGGRVGGSGGNLYIGNSNNAGWVLVQDICSHSGAGDTYWSLHADGSFHCKTITFGGAMTSTGAVEIKIKAGYSLALQADGNLVWYQGTTARWNAKSPGTWNSSRLLKENIKPLTQNDLNNFKKLNIVSYEYKSGMKYVRPGKHFGLLAEEVLQLYPNLVDVPEDYDASKFDISKGICQPVLRLDYIEFVPLLIKIVQNQQDKIESLEHQINQLTLKQKS